MSFPREKAQRRRQGGKLAQRNGAITEQIFEGVAQRYVHQGLISWLKTGAPVTKGRSGFRAAGKGPPDYQIDVLIGDGVPPRHVWIEVKGQTHKPGRGMRAELGLVKPHQYRFMLERLALGIPALVLVKVEQVADWEQTPPRMPSHPGGWWLVPADQWAPGINDASLTLDELDERGARCPDLWGRGEPATAQANPDWLAALKTLEQRSDVPWPSIWPEPTNKDEGAA